MSPSNYFQDFFETCIDKLCYSVCDFIYRVVLQTQQKQMGYAGKSEIEIVEAFMSPSGHGRPIQPVNVSTHKICMAGNT